MCDIGYVDVVVGLFGYGVGYVGIVLGVVFCDGVGVVFVVVFDLVIIVLCVWYVIVGGMVWCFGIIDEVVVF